MKFTTPGDMFLFYPFYAPGTVGSVNLNFTKGALASLFFHYVYFGIMGRGRAGESKYPPHTTNLVLGKRSLVFLGSFKKYYVVVKH